MIRSREPTSKLNRSNNNSQIKCSNTFTSFEREKYDKIKEYFIGFSLLSNGRDSILSKDAKNDGYSPNKIGDWSSAIPEDDTPPTISFKTKNSNYHPSNTFINHNAYKNATSTVNNNLVNSVNERINTNYYRNFSDWKSHMIYYKQIKNTNRNLPDFINKSLRKYYNNNSNIVLNRVQLEIEENLEGSRAISNNSIQNELNSRNDNKEISRLFRELLGSGPSLIAKTTRKLRHNTFHEKHRDTPVYEPLNENIRHNDRELKNLNQLDSLKAYHRNAHKIRLLQHNNNYESFLYNDDDDYFYERRRQSNLSKIHADAIESSRFNNISTNSYNNIINTHSNNNSNTSNMSNSGLNNGSIVKNFKETSWLGIDRPETKSDLRLNVDLPFDNEKSGSNTRFMPFLKGSRAKRSFKHLKNKKVVQLSDIL